MYNGIICDVFIASSNDLQEEKTFIERECLNWNHIHGQCQKAFFQPRFCEKDGYAAFCRPQDQLNKTLDECDITVALVWYKFADGLREELERSIKQRKKILVYFCKRGVPLDAEVNRQAIQEFQKAYEKNVYWWTFEEPEELARLFAAHLAQTVNEELAFEFKNFRKQTISLRNSDQLNLELPTVSVDKRKALQLYEAYRELSQESLDILVAAVEQRKMIEFHRDSTNIEGRMVYITIEKDCFEYNDFDYWDLALENLRKKDLISYGSRGYSITYYQYTGLGYDLVKSLPVLKRMEERGYVFDQAFLNELDNFSDIPSDNSRYNEQTGGHQAPLLGDQFILYFVTEDGEYDTFTVVNIAKNPYKSLYTLAEIQELLAKEYTSYATLERDLPDEITIQACDYSSFFELFSRAKLLSMTKNQGWQSIFQNAEQSIALHFQALHRLNQLQGINDGIVEKVWGVNQDDDIPF